jgi:hypothetical protein
VFGHSVVNEPGRWRAVIDQANRQHASVLNVKVIEWLTRAGARSLAGFKGRLNAAAQFVGPCQTLRSSLDGRIVGAGFVEKP